MNNKNYLLEITNHGKYALWQSTTVNEGISSSLIITKPIGEKSSAIYTKSGGDEQGLVIIDKDFCVIEALAQEGHILQILVKKVSKIEDNLATTRILYEFKEGQWNEKPLAFFEKAISICMYNAQNPDFSVEYFSINQKMAFYRNYQKQCG